MLLLVSIIAYALLSVIMLLAGLVRRAIDRPLRYVCVASVMAGAMVLLLKLQHYHIQTMFSYIVCGVSIGIMFVAGAHVCYAFTLPNTYDDMLKRIERNEI